MIESQQKIGSCARSRTTVLIELSRLNQENETADQRELHGRSRPTRQTWKCQISGDCRGGGRRPSVILAWTITTAKIACAENVKHDFETTYVPTCTVGD